MLKLSWNARSARNAVASVQALEYELLNHLRQRKPAWSREVRESLLMLELAERNDGLEHVGMLACALPHQAA